MHSQACKLCPMAGILLQHLEMNVLLPDPVTPMIAMNTSKELDQFSNISSLRDGGAYRGCKPSRNDA